MQRELTILVDRSRSLPGVWIAHCLDLDLIAQGESVEDALSDLREVVKDAVLDDLNHDLNPFERNAAPAEFYAALDAAKQWQGAPEDRDVGVFMLRIRVEQVESEPTKSHSARLRLPWQIEAHTQSYSYHPSL